MTPVEEFWAEVERSLVDGSYLGTTLSQPRDPAPENPQKWTVRPTIVRGERVCQWASQRDNRETHENLSLDHTARRMRELIGGSYARANVFTAAADFEVRLVRDGELTVRRSRPSRSPTPLVHNRAKAYLIPENVPCPFLAEIGVMTPQGKVRAAKTAKFRQINRFLELVNDVVDQLPPTGPLRVVDFGSGKSYLTFALHHLLTEIHRREVSILGIERQAGVVADCSRISQRLGCRGLEFRVGEIAEQRIEGTVDLAVSLHACDTATDDALAQAVAWQATVILAVPCCQHELASRMELPNLSALERHGVLHERFASLATDALRAQALEACGYKTQVVEFIDMEHTAKNLLIRAVRRTGQNGADAAARNGYEEFKRSLGLGECAADRIVAAACSTVG